MAEPAIHLIVDDRVEFLRVLAVVHGIEVGKCDRVVRAGAFLASELWCNVLRAKSVEDAPDFGLAANAAAQSILALAGGGDVRGLSLAEVEFPAKSSKRSLVAAEKVLEAAGSYLGEGRSRRRSLRLAAAALAPGAGDHRIAAALDVIEANLDAS
jgi:hypothetical protein